jgi:hypothetical protein
MENTKQRLLYQEVAGGTKKNSASDRDDHEKEHRYEMK